MGFCNAKSPSYYNGDYKLGKDCLAAGHDDPSRCGPYSRNNVLRLQAQDQLRKLVTVVPTAARRYELSAIQPVGDKVSCFSPPSSLLRAGLAAAVVAEHRGALYISGSGTRNLTRNPRSQRRAPSHTLKNIQGRV